MVRRRIAHQAMLVALAGLIPFPFVDTWIQGWLRAELVEQLGRHHERPFERAQVRVLSAGHANYILGCVIGLVWWPIKKIFRKLIYVLTVKDAIDAASDAWLRGEMVHRALEKGALPSQSKSVRAAMDAALKTHGRSPVWGPRTRLTGQLSKPDDSFIIRMLAATAQRGGGLAVLAAFDEQLSEALAQE